MRNSTQQSAIPGVTPLNSGVPRRYSDQLFGSKAVAQAVAEEMRLNPQPDWTVDPGDPGMFIHSSVSKSDVQTTPPLSFRQPLHYTYSKRSTGAAAVYRPEVTETPSTEQVWDKGRRFYRPYVGVKQSNMAGQFPVSPQHATDLFSNRHNVELAAMKDIKSDGFNAALAYIESTQSMAVIANNIRRMAGIVKSVTRRNPRVMRRSFNAIKADKRKNVRFGRETADLWLETAYGLRPLMSDTVSTIDAFQKGLAREDQYVVTRKRSVGESSFVVDKSTTITGKQIGATRRAYYSLEHKSRLDEHVSLWFVVSDPTKLVLKELGLTNPLPVVWDKIPLWALLTDWVLPIGQYLDLLDWKLGLTFKGGAYSRFMETTTEVINPSPGEFIVNDHKGRLVDFTRYPYQSPPTLAPPRIRNPFGIERAISSVALLRQRLFL